MWAFCCFERRTLSVFYFFEVKFLLRGLLVDVGVPGILNKCLTEPSHYTSKHHCAKYGGKQCKTASSPAQPPFPLQTVRES